ncbi:M23 family metallopeptidase [Halioxenophilus sp. WMMB6]|uniref:M23 family metallopeptidase n=1 Tax=Halioxenophilus sp. WMMB6 TaxID=3073815 RepID=UPI00295F0AA1|nr:M23 family metallopeptidase [Halioxenophilus sp. WMMB6]
MAAASALPALALEFNQPVQQGAVLVGQVEPGSQVRFGERNLTVSAEGYFVIGLDRDEGDSITLLVSKPNADGERTMQEYSFPVQQREYRLQEVNGVPQQTVTPDPEQVARAKKEGQLAWSARAINSDLQFYRAQFQWPLVGPITGVYGSQRIYNGVPKRPHYGVDIARPTGTRVHAPAGGRVRLAYPDMFYSGGTLIIDHGQGLTSSFIHLSKILVEEGQMVAVGDEIAEVGSTGRATGPHLDWRMNWFNNRVDPALLVGPMPALEE